MTVRRKIHLRLCVGAVLLSFPVAATSTTAVAGTPFAGAPPVDASASASGSATSTSHPFGGFVAAPASAELDPGTTAGVARRVRVTSERLKSDSTLREVTLDRSAARDLDIPGTALAAYQVAATTMTQADPSCGVDWTLLAAIGRVETDHGRHDGARLRPNGVSRPLIRGVALDGRGPVARIPDSDGGRLDGDKVWDRAVGPMQFLPTTWGYAGVDADGDGLRSPDNLNDAALAAAVFLCAAPGRLDQPAGIRTAVHRYNPSDAYVDLVVRVAKAYDKGDLTEITTGSTTLALEATPVVGPDGETVQAAPAPGTGSPPARDRDDSSTGQQDRGGNTGGNDTRDGDGQDTDTRDDGRDGPSDGPGDGPGDGSGGGEKGGGELKEPAKPVRGGDDGPRPGFEKPDPTPEPEPVPEPVLAELSGVLTLVEDVPVVDEITGEEVLVDQWYLDEVLVDDVPVEPILLDVGTDEWLAAEALADLDADGSLTSNAEELTALLTLPVTLTVEEGTVPAVVHAVNGSAYLPPVE